MKLKVTAIRDRKHKTKERVLIKVLEDCNTGDHLLFDNTYRKNGKQSNEWRHVFLFTRKSVKKGEYIRVYTRERKEGDETLSEMDDGTPLHSFFWGLDEPIWNDEGDCAHLYEIADRQAPFCVGKDE